MHKNFFEKKGIDFFGMSWLTLNPIGCHPQITSRFRGGGGQRFCDSSNKIIISLENL